MPGQRRDGDPGRSPGGQRAAHADVHQLAHRPFVARRGSSPCAVVHEGHQRGEGATPRLVGPEAGHGQPGRQDEKLGGAEAAEKVPEIEETVAEADAFRYKPGQFLTVAVPSDRTGTVARCYSLSSAPHETDLLKITVKRTAEGYGSNWLCDNLAKGNELRVLPPSGIFTPADLDADFLLFAGGSGITPVISIAKSALAQGSGKVVLLYANRDERSVIFADALAALAAEHPEPACPTPGRGAAGTGRGSPGRHSRR